MDLALVRTFLAPDYTIGKVVVDGIPLIVTLELPVKDGLPGSAIPEGLYPIVLEPSHKFLTLARTAESDLDRAYWDRYGPAMPHINDIPNRSLIMVHPGNTVAETDGCVLTGKRAEVGFITNSRLAFSVFYFHIYPEIVTGNLKILVTHA